MAGGGSWTSMCKECNKEFMEKKDQQKHYKSQWHRYNLKRKMAGFSAVTEAVFLARRSSALMDEQQPSNNKNNESAAMLYTCGKGCGSSKAHAQHLKSLPKRKEDFHEESDGSDDRKKFDQNVDLARTINHYVKIDGVSSEDEEVDPSCCFMCDQKHKTVESCMDHMHKLHGLFIPDIEFLKDPQGLLTYLGQKVKHDYTCLYCNISCQPFESLEAVRMHMVAKSHCRVHYGDATDEQEEPELDEFYDYSSSYVDENGKQLVATDRMSNGITLGCGGSELVITRATDDGGISTKALGSREYLRYYRQKPRPSPDSIPVTSLRAARYRSMGLSTLQLKEKMERMKLMKQIMKQMNRSGAETMRCKMSIRCNPIRPMNAIH